MEINLLDLWNTMSLPVRVVVVALFIEAIGCLAVSIDRLVLLTLSANRARQFAAAVQGSMESGNYEQMLADMALIKPNHLTSYLDLGLRTYFVRRQAGDNNERSAELARRALGRKGDAVSRDMNRGMNVLASTGSTAPFIGLLGTVLGIINAFKGIASSGSGGIGAIGGSISEALIVTGFGLVVAIPAVLVFNWLSAKIANYEAGMVNAGQELIDRLETSAGQATARGQAGPSGRPFTRSSAAAR